MKPITGKRQLSRLVLNGYKSIAQCDLELGALNILIGANGVGKSNLISFFRMIQQMLDHNLQLFVSRQGGPDSLLHFGRKVTESLKVELYFGNNGYLATFEATQDNRLVIANESFWWKVRGPQKIGSGYFETRGDEPGNGGVGDFCLAGMKSWRVFHFHDTSESAHLKQLHNVADNSYLRPDARNLAAFLYMLERKYPSNFERIVSTIKMVAPFFGKFSLSPSSENREKIELEWFEDGQDIPFKAHHLSDGTLRFICLATVFLQPKWLQPDTILVDEPELGLHPYAISVLAALIRSASSSKQVIVSTQSVELLNEFDPEDVVVVDRVSGKSEFKRLDDEKLSFWLQDYSLGELWNKNLLGGRPSV